MVWSFRRDRSRQSGSAVQDVHSTRSGMQSECLIASRTSPAIDRSVLEDWHFVAKRTHLKTRSIEGIGPPAPLQKSTTCTSPLPTFASTLCTALSIILAASSYGG